MATQKTVPKSTSRKRSPHTAAASSAIDAQLERYRSMRNFDITTEPSGNGPATNTFALRKPTTTRGLPFVIQKHEASHLHYDLRLSWGGILKSWAIAKGPSYNPHDRRLAVQVEDHPLEYGGFEGVIPQGQYGGGTVMIWDQGTWWPQLGSENVDACLRGGHLKFEMNGSKMKGKWALIRMKPSAANSPSAHPNWLLIKEHDKFERDPTGPSIASDDGAYVTGSTYFIDGGLIRNDHEQ